MFWDALAVVSAFTHLVVTSKLEKSLFSTSPKAIFSFRRTVCQSCTVIYVVGVCKSGTGAVGGGGWLGIGEHGNTYYVRVSDLT